MLRVSGFSDKASVLVNFVLSQLFVAMFNGTESSHKDRMSAIIDRQAETLGRSYADENMTAAHASRNARLLCLQPFAFAPELKLQLLKDQFRSEASDSGISSVGRSDSFSTLRNYAAQLWSTLHVDILAEGNITAEQAAHLLDSSTGYPSFTSSAADSLVITRIPTAQSLSESKDGEYLLLHVSPSNPDDKNVCVEMYFQHGDYTLHSVALLELLEQMISEPFFDDIRTKQQVFGLLCGVTISRHLLLLRSWDTLWTAASAKHTAC
jgi:secreted Zn-dependent insulinase-like peptidase